MKKNISKTKFIRTVSIVLLLAISNYSFGFYSYDNELMSVRIPGGTPVVLELNQYVDSEHGFQQNPVHFKVKYNVMVDHCVVIAAGATATGHIVHVNKRKGLGEPGYIEVQVDKVTAIDGFEVMLSSMSIKNEGENREGIALGLGIGLTCVIGPLGLFFLLLKGGEAQLEPGTLLNATVLYDTEVYTLY